MKKNGFLLISTMVFSIGMAQSANFTISASASKGGMINPAGKISVASGATQAVSASAKTGYYLTELKVDGNAQTLSDYATYLYTFNNVTTAHKISAKFLANPVISASTNKGGSITPAGKTSVPYAQNQSYTITPNTGYHIKDVLVDGVSKGAITNQVFSNVVSKHKLSAKFDPDTYQITTSAGANGKISPANQTVKYGGKSTFTISPAKGSQIATVTVDGVSQTGIPASGNFKLNLKSITKDTVIAATFVTKSAGKVSGLTVGSQVSVVDAQANTQNAPMLSTDNNSAPITLNAPLITVPLDSDYNKDKTNIYVNEKSGDAFKTVNMILCMIEQTKYSDSHFVNQGYYKAMINSDVCSGNDSADNSDSSAQAGTSAGAAPSYDTWITKSERSSNTSKQLLTAYVHLNKGGPDEGPMTVHAKIEVSEGASSDNPLGIFTMNFKGLSDASPNMVLMKGILKTERVNGNIMIRFAELEGPENAPFHVSKAAYSKNDTNKTGQGSAYQLDNHDQQEQESSINFAYNSAFFKRVDPETEDEVCLDRNKFETSAWRYGLYSSLNGKRASINGGFPINTKQNGSGVNGYLGYYGLNLPPNSPALADGDTVFKSSWENGQQSKTPYTLVVKGGKLKKHTRAVISLNDIKNIPLEGSIPTPGSMNQSTQMNRITWDGNSLAIRATAAMAQNGPPAWADLNPATAIDSNYVLPFSNLGLYSSALGGRVSVQLDNCVPVQQNNPNSGVKCSAPTANTSVVFYKEDTVSPGDVVPPLLSCYENCPKADTNTGMDGANQQSLVYQQDFNPGSNNQHDYAFTDMQLIDKVSNFPAVLTTAPAGQSFGFNSGPMFESNQANLGKLSCDWNPNQICGWKAWNSLEEFYTWETGPNSWNKFTAVKDANGGFVSFDPPLQVEYVYPADGTAGVNRAEVDSKYRGSKFFLQYNGFGNLQGIPGKCVNPADPSQQVSDCSQPGFRWVPEFTIPADATLAATGTEYLVKPLDIEQRMSKVDGACTDLNPVDISSQWPNVATDWVNPNLAQEPTINEAPKVIGGVIQ